jgi:hypothetical protein
MRNNAENDLGIYMAFPEFVATVGLKLLSPGVCDEKVFCAFRRKVHVEQDGKADTARPL